MRQAIAFDDPSGQYPGVIEIDECMLKIVFQNALQRDRFNFLLTFCLPDHTRLQLIYGVTIRARIRIENLHPVNKYSLALHFRHPIDYAMIADIFDGQAISENLLEQFISKKSREKFLALVKEGIDSPHTSIEPPFGSYIDNEIYSDKNNANDIVMLEQNNSYFMNRFNCAISSAEQNNQFHNEVNKLLFGPEGADEMERDLDHKRANEFLIANTTTNPLNTMLVPALNDLIKYILMQLEKKKNDLADKYNLLAAISETPNFKLNGTKNIQEIPFTRILASIKTQKNLDAAQEIEKQYVHHSKKSGV